MKTFTLCATLIAMTVLGACTKHEKETIVERTPQEKTVIVVPEQ